MQRGLFKPAGVFDPWSNISGAFTYLCDGRCFRGLRRLNCSGCLHCLQYVKRLPFISKLHSHPHAHPLPRTPLCVRRCSRTGASLLETLLVAAIVSLLISQALPGFRSLFDRIRVSTAAADFRAALAVARTAAIRRGQRIDVLPVSPAGWQTGWRVVIDLNNNQRIDAGEPVLRSGPELPAGVVIDTALTDARRVYLAFDPSGRPRSADSATVPQFGSLLFRSGGERRKLVIGFLGRTRLCDPDRERSAC